MKLPFSFSPISFLLAFTVTTLALQPPLPLRSSSTSATSQSPSSNLARWTKGQIYKIAKEAVAVSSKGASESYLLENSNLIREELLAIGILLQNLEQYANISATTTTTGVSVAGAIRKNDSVSDNNNNNDGVDDTMDKMKNEKQPTPQRHGAFTLYRNSRNSRISSNWFSIRKAAAKSAPFSLATLDGGTRFFPPRPPQNPPTQYDLRDAALQYQMHLWNDVAKYWSQLQQHWARLEGDLDRVRHRLDDSNSRNDMSWRQHFQLAETLQLHRRTQFQMSRLLQVEDVLMNVNKAMVELERQRRDKVERLNLRRKRKYQVWNAVLDICTWPEDEQLLLEPRAMILAQQWTPPPPPPPPRPRDELSVVDKREQTEMRRDIGKETTKSQATTTKPRVAKGQEKNKEMEVVNAERAAVVGGTPASNDEAAGAESASSPKQSLDDTITKVLKEEGLSAREIQKVVALLSESSAEKTIRPSFKISNERERMATAKADDTQLNQTTMMTNADDQAAMGELMKEENGVEIGMLDNREAFFAQADTSVDLAVGNDNLDTVDEHVEDLEQRNEFESDRIQENGQMNEAQNTKEGNKVNETDSPVQQSAFAMKPMEPQSEIGFSRLETPKEGEVGTRDASFQQPLDTLPVFGLIGSNTIRAPPQSAWPKREEKNEPESKVLVDGDDDGDDKVVAAWSKQEKDEPKTEGWVSRDGSRDDEVLMNQGIETEKMGQPQSSSSKMPPIPAQLNAAEMQKLTDSFRDVQMFGGSEERTSNDIVDPLEICKAAADSDETESTARHMKKQRTAVRKEETQPSQELVTTDSWLSPKKLDDTVPQKGAVTDDMDQTEPEFDVLEPTTVKETKLPTQLDDTAIQLPTDKVAQPSKEQNVSELQLSVGKLDEALSFDSGNVRSEDRETTGPLVVFKEELANELETQQPSTELQRQTEPSQELVAAELQLAMEKLANPRNSDDSRVAASDENGCTNPDLVSLEASTQVNGTQLQRNVTVTELQAEVGQPRKELVAAELPLHKMLDELVPLNFTTSGGAASDTDVVNSDTGTLEASSRGKESQAPTKLLAAELQPPIVEETQTLQGLVAAELLLSMENLDDPIPQKLDRRGGSAASDGRGDTNAGMASLDASTQGDDTQTAAKQFSTELQPPIKEVTQSAEELVANNLQLSPETSDGFPPQNLTGDGTTSEDKEVANSDTTTSVSLARGNATHAPTLLAKELHPPSEEETQPAQEQVEAELQLSVGKLDDPVPLNFDDGNSLEDKEELDVSQLHVDKSGFEAVGTGSEEEEAARLGVASWEAYKREEVNQLPRPHTEFLNDFTDPSTNTEDLAFEEYPVAPTTSEHTKSAAEVLPAQGGDENFVAFKPPTVPSETNPKTAASSVDIEGDKKTEQQLISEDLGSITPPKTVDISSAMETEAVGQSTVFSDESASTKEYIFSAEIPRELSPPATQLDNFAVQGLDAVVGSLEEKDGSRILESSSRDFLVVTPEGGLVPLKEFDDTGLGRKGDPTLKRVRKGSPGMSKPDPAPATFVITPEGKIVPAPEPEEPSPEDEMLPNIWNSNKDETGEEAHSSVVMPTTSKEVISPRALVGNEEEPNGSSREQAVTPTKAPFPGPFGNALNQLHSTKLTSSFAAKRARWGKYENYKNSLHRELSSTTGSETSLRGSNQPLESGTHAIQVNWEKAVADEEYERKQASPPNSLPRYSTVTRKQINPTYGSFGTGQRRDRFGRPTDKEWWE